MATRTTSLPCSKSQLIPPRELKLSLALSFGAATISCSHPALFVSAT